MSETYRFVWGEVKAVMNACKLARELEDKVENGQLETSDFDLYFDLIGISIRIPHDLNLDRERSLGDENKAGTFK